MAGLEARVRNMHSSGWRRFVPVFLAILLLWACGRQKHSEQGLLFNDWYIVKPMVPGGMTTAYGSIRNNRAEPVTLTGVKLACADKTELHETVESAGRMAMLPLTDVVIAAGETASFSPGKKHLMVSRPALPADEQCEATFMTNRATIRFFIPIRQRSE